MEFFLSNDLDYTEKQFLGFIQAYDADKDGCLSQEEFLEAILPNKSASLRKIVANRKAQTLT